jgi:polyisoprenoid-binding protein YceI
MHLPLPLSVIIGSVALAGVATNEPSSRVPIHANSIDSAAVAAKYVVAGSGNEARYRVREHLVGSDTLNDAVAVTSAITGQIAFAKDGTLVPGESKFTIDVSGLKSDSNMRDRFIGWRVLETKDHPSVVFEPTEVRGLKGLPKDGSASFELAGNLTVHGTTKPSVWNVTANIKDGKATGTAKTTFTFAEFGLTQPKVPKVAFVADTIRLEYDFTLEKK